ncbi:MAG: hypothetical protein OK438_04545 [Thaumarchaeota archaeon]|nr:hypothetical protein [Nitrososphaerota archaeon]
MASVRQAHLPGNYELYDPDSSKPGEVLCKMCWEEGRKMNVDSLDTVWISSDGWLVVWWLCRNHGEAIKSRSSGSIQFLKIVRGIVRAPGLELDN